MHNFFIWLALVPVSLIALILLIGGMLMLIVTCSWNSSMNFKDNVCGSLLAAAATIILLLVSAIFASIGTLLSDKLW